MLPLVVLSANTQPPPPTPPPGGEDGLGCRQPTRAATDNCNIQVGGLQGGRGRAVHPVCWERQSRKWVAGGGRRRAGGAAGADVGAAASAAASAGRTRCSGACATVEAPRSPLQGLQAQGPSTASPVLEPSALAEALPALGPTASEIDNTAGRGGPLACPVGALRR